MIRIRRLARDSEMEVCQKELGSSLKLQEEKPCQLEKSDRRCDPTAICSDGKVVRCITGTSSIRYYYHVKTGKCESYKYYGCKGSLNSFKSLESCESTCSKVMSELTEARTAQLITLQSESSRTEEKVPKKQEKIPDKCFLQANNSEDCKNSELSAIWYYNHRMGKCLSLIDFQCYGNFNKFPTYKECMKTCAVNSPQDQETVDKIDCKVSSWSHWGPCSAKCGAGKQLRNRSIQKDTINGGKACPALYESRDCFEKLC